MLTSATIANPTELAGRLTGLEDFELIDRDGSPRVERRIALVDPPIVDERTGGRASALGEAARIVAGLVQSGSRTICFIKSRKAVEVLARLVRSGSTANLLSASRPTAPVTPRSSAVSSSIGSPTATCWP